MLFGYDLYALWEQGKKEITNCFERSWPWLRKQFSSVRKQVISKMSLDLVQGVQLRRKFPKKMLMILLQILHNSNCAVMDPTRNGKLPLSEGLLENILLKFYLFVAMLCLCCCAQAFSSCRTRASHCGGFFCCRVLDLGYRGFSSCGVRALLPCGRWNLPRPGIKPVFPALDG